MTEQKHQICPVCGKPAEKAHRPFCSARCKLIDLGRWLGEKYRVRTDETPSDDELINNKLPKGDDDHE